MLTNTRAILLDAQRNGYAIGAFNVYNYETISAVIEVAKEEAVPAILAFGERYLENMDLRAVRAIVATLAADADIPVVLHLDHSKRLDTIIQAICAGFTSVMYDGSHLSFAENVAATKEVVRIAGSVGVTVEGELGSLAAGSATDEEGADEIYTDPARAGEFVAATGVDALAVSIGTVHGMYKAAPKIDIGILKKIRQATPVPLVLHGGSGTPGPVIRECIQSGICKINVNTEISLYTVGKLKAQLASRELHLSQVSLLSREYSKEIVRKYVKMFFANGT